MTPNFRRQWALPILLLTSVALVVFWGFYAVDHFYPAHVQAAPPQDPLERYLRFDPLSLADALSALGGMIAAVFGIVITVVSIIVQLSAARYTGVTRMFLKDRITLAVMAYYVIACVCGVWLSVALQHDYVPRAALVAMLAMTTLGIVLMGPYFGYVFWFLEPMNIITRIRTDAVKTASSGARERDVDRALARQAATLSAMEELTDITSHSISDKDKVIASGAVDALKDFTLAYLEHKSAAGAGWFEIGPGIRNNPDFVAMDPESLQDLAARKTWVEWKVMRQYLGIYNEALVGMRDINYLIAIDTRYIGECAARARDHELLELVLRFMNSYLRFTINAKEVRTAYNVLNQYRLLLEALLREGHGQTVLQGVRHMNYYGHVSFDARLTFVTETVAYDLSALCQYAHELGAPEEEAILEQLLELDRPLRTRSQESALLGVRKAQVKLAAYYLASDAREQVQRIARDMQNEPFERLRAIRESLERVRSKDFWEIIDRGRNFEYMPENQRQCLSAFFELFQASTSGRPAVT